MSFIRANLLTINNKKANFTAKKEIFNNTSYPTFKNGYISTCSDSTVKRMKNKLDGLYKKIESGYSSINNYWDNYVKDFDSLEESLKNFNAACTNPAVNSHIAPIASSLPKKLTNATSFVQNNDNVNVNTALANGANYDYAMSGIDNGNSVNANETYIDINSKYSYDLNEIYNYIKNNSGLNFKDVLGSLISPIGYGLYDNYNFKKFLEENNIKSIDETSNKFVIEFNDGIKLYLNKETGEITNIYYNDKMILSDSIASIVPLEDVSCITSTDTGCIITTNNGLSFALALEEKSSYYELNGIKMVCDGIDVSEILIKNRIDQKNIKTISAHGSEINIEFNNGIKCIFSDNKLISATHGEINLMNYLQTPNIKIMIGDINGVYYEENSIIIEGQKGIKYQFNIDTKKIELITIGTDVFYYNEDGYIYKHVGDSVSIFDNENSIFGQYGGNQMDFRYYVSELSAERELWETFIKYFPDATPEDYVLYMRKIANIGCGYVAQINCIFKEYEGREQEFLDTFGFSMYKIDENGHIDYNYEALILDWFSYYWTTNRGYQNIEDIYGNIKEITAGDAALTGEVSTGATGTPIESYDVFKEYLSHYGITFDFEVIYTDEYGNNFNEIITKEMWEEYIKQGKQIIYSSAGYDLYMIDPSTGERGSIFSLDGGAHAMYITGFTENGDIIVSTWGERFILDPSNEDWGNYKIVNVEI